MDDVTFVDNSKKVLNELNTVSAKALWAIGATAEGHAKDNETRIDTGRLRNSITFATSEGSGGGSSPANSEDYTPLGTPAPMEVYIGTNVEYARYIEEGTSKMSGLHFLKEAATAHSDEYKKIMKAAMEGN